MAQATVSTTLTERMFTLEDFYNYDVKSLKISRQNTKLTLRAIAWNPVQKSA
jgi:hypothetical protein